MCASRTSTLYPISPYPMASSNHSSRQVNYSACTTSMCRSGRRVLLGWLRFPEGGGATTLMGCKNATAEHALHPLPACRGYGCSCKSLSDGLFLRSNHLAFVALHYGILLLRRPQRSMGAVGRDLKRCDPLQCTQD